MSRLHHTRRQIRCGCPSNRWRRAFSGSRLAMIGLGRDHVGNLLRSSAPSSRSALLLEAGPVATADAILDRLLDDLADLALARWPHWIGAYYSDGRLSVSDPFVSTPWVRAAAKLAAIGRRPRFRRSARAFEFGQLTRAVDAVAPILIASVDPASPQHAVPIIQVLEWCAGQGASIVVTFATRPPPVPLVSHGPFEKPIRQNQMPRGGKRAGAGRRPGVPNRRTVARRQLGSAAAAKGSLPLEVTLACMRFHHASADRELEKGDAADPEAIANALQAAHEAAKDAAPYLHPRLSGIAHTGIGDGAEANPIQRLLDAIDGKSRSIPEANQRMKDVTPVDQGPRDQPDSAPMGLLLPLRKTHGSGSDHG
jgi:hypothetical protein